MKKLKLAIILLSVLALFACNNIFEEIENSINKENTQNGAQTTSANRVLVTINATLPNQNATTNTRGVMATLPDLVYLYSGSDSEGNTINGTVDNSVMKIELVQGTIWNVIINVAEKNDVTKIIFTGSKQIDTSGVDYNFYVPLELYKESLGTLSINLKNTTSDNLMFSFQLIDQDNQVIKEEENVTFNTGSSTTKGYTDLTPGNYKLKIFFYKNNSIVYCINTTATIFAGQISDKFILNDTSITEFNLTTDSVNDFASKVLYVKGQDSTSVLYDAQNNLVTASDTNVGGAYSPLATVCAAINKCTDDTEDYIIFVEGTTKETMQGKVVAKSVTIQPIGESATMELADDIRKSLIYVTSGSELRLENITIDGKKDSYAIMPDNTESINGGGAIYNNGGNVFITEGGINNFFTNGTNETFGAAIANYGGELNLTGCSFDGNYATGMGGAIYSSNSGKITAESVSFTNNCAISTSSTGCGGAVAINDGTQDESYIFSVCNFYNNQVSYSGDDSTDCGSGGAVFIKNAVAEFESCGFNSNKASKNGGAVCIAKEDSTWVTMEDVTLLNNNAKKGGAIYNSDMLYITEDNNELYQNTATEAGGAIYSEYVVDLQKCDIHDNEIQVVDNDGYGAGLYIAGTDLSQGSTVKNCKIYNNKIESAEYSSYGGGLYISAKAETELENCQIFANIVGVNDSSAEAYGGGIFVAENAPVKIKDGFIGKKDDPNKAVVDSSGEAFGGAIYSKGTVTLDSCKLGQTGSFTDGTQVQNGQTASSTNFANYAQKGGAVYIAGGTFETNSLVGFNYAGEYGSAIFLNDGTLKLLQGSEICGNTGNVTLWCQSGTVELDGKIHHNIVTSDVGLYFYDCTATMKENAQITDNNSNTKSEANYGNVLIAGSAVFNMQGGKIANNHTTDTNYYEVVVVGAFIISGNATVGNPEDTDEHNSIFLQSTSNNVTIAGALTSSQDPVARISQANGYTNNTQILTAADGFNLSTVYSLFRVYKKEGKVITLGSDGKVKVENAPSGSNVDLEKNVGSIGEIVTWLEAIKDLNEPTLKLNLTKDIDITNESIVIPANTTVTIKSENNDITKNFNCKKQSAGFNYIKVEEDARLSLINIWLIGESNSENDAVAFWINGIVEMNNCTIAEFNQTGTNARLITVCDNKKLIMTSTEIDSNTTVDAIVYLDGSGAKFEMQSGKINRNNCTNGSVIAGTGEFMWNDGDIGESENENINESGEGSIASTVSFSSTSDKKKEDAH